MASVMFLSLVFSLCISTSLGAVLFNPFNPFASQQKTTTRAPIPIVYHPSYFYNVPVDTSSTTTNSGQSSTTTATTTETTTATTTQSTTTAATTLPPNFCKTSSVCPAGSCCRDLNNQIILMSEVFDMTGPYSSRTANNGTCTNTRAQLGERCNDFCDCEIGLTCFRDVNKPCCEAAVCQYKAALEKNVQVWMKCFEDDKCEVFEDSSEEDDDSSDELSTNSTSSFNKRFRVPHHLVPSVKTLIAQQTDEESESEESDEMSFTSLFNDSLIQNITNALLEDDSGEDSSSEEDELTFFLQEILKDLLNTTTKQPSQPTTTPSPTSTTESLLSLFFNSKKQKSTLLNTKSLARNQFVDVKQGIKHATRTFGGNSLFNVMNKQQISSKSQSQQAKTNKITSANVNIQHAANLETLRVLNALHAGNTMLNQAGLPSQQIPTTTMDPLTAMLANSIASQFNIPMPAPSPQVSGIQPQGIMNVQQSLPGGGSLNINVNQQSIATTTKGPILPDLNFLASHIGPNSKLAPKLKRLQLLLAKKKGMAAAPLPMITPTTTSPIPLISPMANLMPLMPPMNNILSSMANVMPAMADIMPPMHNVMPAVSNMMPPLHNAIPTVPNIIPPLQNVIPTVPNIMPPLQNVIQAVPNIMPPINNVVPTVPTVMAAITGVMSALPSQQTINNHQKLLSMLTRNNKGTSQNDKQMMLQMLQATKTASQNPALSALSRSNAAKALQTIELLEIIKKKKANRKLKKALKGRKIISLDKKMMKSLSTKDSSTINVIKQLQALRMSQNSTVLSFKLKSINGTRRDESDESDESEELLNISNSTLSANATDDEDDSDESDEEINMLLSQILTALGKTPNKTSRTTVTTTTTQGTSTAAPPSSTTGSSTTPMNMFLKNILLQDQISRRNHVKQNVIQNKASQSTKQSMDLKSLSWNDVVAYFKTNRSG